MPGPSTVLGGWDALHYGANGAYADPYHPPDVQVAASPTHVVEMVNLLMGVYTKQGVEVGVSSLVTLFNSGTDFVSDPKVQYDSATGRWFASLTDVTLGQVLLATSATSDPTGTWIVRKVPSSSTGECLDQPILGVGTTTVIVSVNVFSQTKSNPCTTPYLGAQYWVVNKTDLVTGAATPATYASLIDINEGSIHPVQIEGTGPDHYMVSTYWPGAATTSNTLHLFTVSGTPPGLVTVTLTSLSMPTAAIPPPAPQLGVKNTIDTADIRIAEAAWAGGQLWLGFDEACLSDSARACIRLVEIDTTAGAILQDFDIDVAGKDVFYPAFRMDGAGSLAVTFGYSSASDDPGVMVSGRLTGDAPNALQPPSVVAAGSGPEAPSGCTGTCRYGDYFGAGLDPSNTSVVWLAGEFGTPSGWSTRIVSEAVKAALTFNYGIVGGGPALPTPTLTYESNGVARVAPLTSVPTSYYADPGSSWSVTPFVENPAVPGEFWSINDLVANPPYVGTANASRVATYTFYHQYSVRLGYDIPGWDPHVAMPPAHVNVTRFGQPASVAAGALWVLDAGTGYVYENPLQTSTSTYRIFAGGLTSGTVTGVLNLTVHYFPQYLVTFEYLVQASAPVPAPTVHYFSEGTNTSVAANATVWADAGQPYAFSASLTGDGGYARIGPGAGAVGTITASGTISVMYRLQYLLTVHADPAFLLGNVSGGGWYDVGSLATVAATIPLGWKFIGWSGAVSGSNATATVTMGDPANVTAVFYAGLTIAAGAGGSVTYSYGSTSGVVPAGGSATVYVPVGTAVLLSARPSSVLGAFESWTGAASGAGSNTTLTLSGPATVTASFGTSLLAVAGIVAGVIVVILAALLLFVAAARRRKKPPPA